MDFFNILKDECTLAVFFIFTNKVCGTHQQDSVCVENLNQTKFLISLLKGNDDDNYCVHLISKALACLADFHCDTWHETKLLYFRDIISTIKKIIGYGEMCTTREATRVLSKMISYPEGMVVWLKFASPCLTVNSACTDDVFVHWGQPHRLPENRGLYRNWGAFFDYGDVIEIPGGVQVNSVIMEQWTISFWMVVPLFLEAKKAHVLV